MKLAEKGLFLVSLTTIVTVSLANQARADLLGRVIVGGVTNQALTQVTKKDCPNATGAGADACDAADAVVDVHQDISHAANQVVQSTCQNATGVGEDACQGIDDVNSFKKHLAEQVSHLHLFGSHHSDTQNSPPENQNPAVNGTTPSGNSPAVDQTAPTGTVSTP
jgi:hypothetical protein